MVERLEFPEALRQELIAHAREGDPDEVCGILAGRDGQASLVTDEIAPLLMLPIGLALRKVA